jgi:HAD superfamily hydrolase (TIGR01549 family)
MEKAVVVDIDGTLVDTNYQHAIAWFRAFCQRGIVLPVWRIHRHIGMGADQLVGALAGEAISPDLAEAIRTTHRSEYAKLIEEVQPFPDAISFLGHVKGLGYQVVLATSASDAELEHYLGLLKPGALVDAYVNASSVQATKPEPDLVTQALAACDARSGVLIGDSVFDCIAAERAGIATLAVLTGGFCASELRQAGALSVFDCLGQLIEQADWGRTMV